MSVRGPHYTTELAARICKILRMVIKEIFKDSAVVNRI